MIAKGKKRVAQPDWQQSIALQEGKGESPNNFQQDKTQPQDKAQRPKAVKQLSLRIDDSTHQRISLAAQKAGKSINAWIEEVVSEAADDLLGGVDGEINSESIRLLIEDDEYAVRLIEGIAPYLRDSSPPTIFKFSSALKKLLVGWDGMLPLLGAEEFDFSSKLTQLIDELDSVSNLVLALFSFSLKEDTESILHLSAALKKFLLGITAVSPFIKKGIEEKRTENILNVVVVIEALLREIENDASAH